MQKARHRDEKPQLLLMTTRSVYVHSFRISRQVSQPLGVTKVSLQRLIKAMGLCPYIIQMCQPLKEGEQHYAAERFRKPHDRGT